MLRFIRRRPQRWELLSFNLYILLHRLQSSLIQESRGRGWTNESKVNRVHAIAFMSLGNEIQSVWKYRGRFFLMNRLDLNGSYAWYVKCFNVYVYEWLTVDYSWMSLTLSDEFNGQFYTGTSYAIDGCATFFRRDRFTLVKKYEVLVLPWTNLLPYLKQNFQIQSVLEIMFHYSLYHHN